MKLVVGLGNPGFRYRNTRHNIGFLVVKEISKKHRISIKKRKYKGLLGQGSIGGEKVSLFIPLTFMNLSGEAVEEIVKKSKMDSEAVLIICDDINLRFGFMRLRKKGSSGGHKGLESIIEALGTNDFPRLRIGIGKSDKNGDIVNFVLKPFDLKERAHLKNIIDRATECAVTWVKQGPDQAMTTFNRRQFP